METDVEASEYIDTWVATQISDLALISKTTKAVDSLAPWLDEQRACEIAMSRDAVQLAIDRVRSVTGSVSVGIMEGCKRATMSVNKNFIDYPVGKRLSKANSEKTRRAEDQLDMFWWSLQNEVKAICKISLVKVFENRRSYLRTLYRTPAWQEPVQLPSPAIALFKTALSEMDPNIGTCPNLPDHKTTETKRIKDKVKTRGIPAAADPRSITFQEPAAKAVHRSDTQQKPKISKKAYRVFCALLPGTHGVMQQRGKLSWDDLIAAFDAIGFVPEKLYGSVWSFTPRPKDQRAVVDVARPMQFHEPKEVRRGQKIPRPMVRTFGRRLKHAYGWECAETMFECE